MQMTYLMCKLYVNDPINIQIYANSLINMQIAQLICKRPWYANYVV